MNRRMAEPVAGHFRRAAHGEIHFALLFHLFHVTIGDLISHGLLAPYHEFPALALAARGRPTRAGRPCPDHSARTLTTLVVSSWAAPLLTRSLSPFHIQLAKTS